MSSLQTPPVNRSARSTPAANASAYTPPGEAISSPNNESIPFVPAVPATSPPEHPPTSGSDDTVAPPIQPAASHDSTRSRPVSRSGAFVTPKGATRTSHDVEPLQYSGGSMSSRRRFREDWDFDPNADHPTLGDYERYWRNEARPDRYTSRRYPPPSFMNRRRVVAPHDSDEEYYYSDDARFGKDPFETTRGRRLTDEEMGFQSSHPAPRHRPSTLNLNGVDLSSGKLDWNNLTPQEKKQVMRLPLTQWMNSDFKNHFVASLGELIGTTMFLFFAFAGTEVANIQSDTTANTTTGESTGFSVATLLYISIIFGFSLMVNVWVFFRISGGLFNPAVTIAMLMVKAISITRAVCLFVSQILGAMLASVMVLYLFPEAFNVRTTLGGGASLVQGVFIEAILTAELVFTIFMLAKEKHRATFIAPVGIGLALFIAEMVGVQFTGGSLNPARSFGPCVVTKTFDSEHWIYWVGPFVGSLIAVCFYWFIKTLEYEMANPGADGDDANDPTKNPEKRAEMKAAKPATVAFGIGKSPSIRS
ncbi:aquaporin [Fusarium albosuccineum]|uniref:Aquaporin n=1 Tax=Fusarium albosuccineum TaxID=1237068 RepID=A0A8H4PHB8_9HYPO|nr:aquaporin [Fusarium albosuccineum]